MNSQADKDTAPPLPWPWDHSSNSDVDPHLKSNAGLRVDNFLVFGRYVSAVTRQNGSTHSVHGSRIMSPLL
jgi:hypothetical protein